jgi:hypothetical protein
MGFIIPCKAQGQVSYGHLNSFAFGKDLTPISRHISIPFFKDYNPCKAQGQDSYGHLTPSHLGWILLL